MKTIVYVDGFNLYYGALKGTPYRWLNLAEMCRQLLPMTRLSVSDIFKPKGGLNYSL